MLVVDLLLDSAKRHPHQIATVHRGEHLTYSDIEALSWAVALEVKERGVAPGERVLLLMDNSAEFVASFFGVLLAGAAVVPIDIHLVQRELVGYLEDCAPSLVITDPGRTTFVESALGELGSPPPCMAVDRLKPANNSCVAEVRGSSEDLAAVVYTSGTTGKPRGVMLSHGSLLANASSIVQYLPTGPQERAMVVLPFTHSYGISLLTTTFKVGGRLVIDNRFAYPKVVLDTMQREEVTSFSGVPSHYAILLRKSDLRHRQLPSLEYVTQAGGSLAPSLVEEFLALLPDVKFYVMYGQTEASARLTYLEPELVLCKRGSVGRAIPGVELQVLDERGERVRPGQVGEIVAKGGNVMLGYLNAPNETASVLRQGCLFTGDLARIDEEGYVYLMGRSKEMIKSGGNRISPLEIEAVVCEVPGVVECAAVGVPDEILGESVRLMVVLDNAEGPSEATLMAHCKENLASYKVPRQIEVVPNLPKTGSGKIRRSELPSARKNA